MEAEQGVWGCVMLDQKAFNECVIRLGTAEAFYDLRHQVIYRTCVRLSDQAKPLDIVSLVDELKKHGQLESIGGMSYLMELQTATPSPANLPYWLDIVVENFQLRRLIQTCTSLVGRAFDCQNPNGLVDEAEREIMAVRTGRPATAFGIKDLVHQSIAQIERYHQQQGAISGLSTGLIDLDKMTDGLHPEEMTVIAAYPGHGKTSLAINIAEHVAIDLQLAVGIFSLEMSALQLVLRMLASRARVNLRSVKAGFLAERDFPKLTMAAGKIATSKIFLDDISSLSIQQIRASARRMAQQHGIKLVLIDYIQLVGSQGRKDQNREQEISEISRGIKGLAKELKIPVLALSQLNDDGKLRESRAIGQDADNVWVLASPVKDDPEEENREAKPMTLTIRKQRNGPTGNVYLTFLKTCTRFESAAKVDGDDYPQGRNPHND